MRIGTGECFGDLRIQFHIGDSGGQRDSDIDLDGFDHVSGPCRNLYGDGDRGFSGSEPDNDLYGGGKRLQFNGDTGSCKYGSWEQYDLDHYGDLVKQL